VAITRDITERKKLESQLRELSRTDGLTGIPNRRAFDDALSIEWRRAMRESGAQLSLALVDIDHFKKFNDHTAIPPKTIASVSLLPQSARRCSVRAISPHALAARNSPFCCPTPMRGVQRS
jgi:predicted signal transduction protein with EAL and GGDEF domain